MPNKPINVDEYLAIGCGRCKFGGTPQCKVRSWTTELQLLRCILKETDLKEEVKWNAPCYTHSGKNILMLSALKDSVVISFFKGAQLADPQNLLELPGENSRFARYLRFTDSESISGLKPTILAYVKNALALEIMGSVAAPAVSGALPDLPEELTLAFEKDPGFERAFSKLTPGRQRGYLIHFNSAKQSKTKTERIEKCRPKILTGKGWNER